MSTDEMSCRELVEVVTDYLEGALVAADRRRFEAHLDACDGCRTFLEQMRRTIRLVGRLDDTAISPEAEAALLHAFREWKSA